MTPEHKAAIAAGRERARAAGRKPKARKSATPTAVGFSINDRDELTIDGGKWACPLDADTTRALATFLARWFTVRAPTGDA